MADFQDAFAYGYENVGAGPTATKESTAYGYQNVGLQWIQTREGNSFGYANIGAEEVVIPVINRIERWGTLIEGRRLPPIVDSRLDGHAYGYENVEDPPPSVPDTTGLGLLAHWKADGTLFQDAAGTVPVTANSPVGFWTDESGNNNHLTKNVGDFPMYKTGVLGGRSIVRFDGINDYLEHFTISALRPNTIFVVAKHNNTPCYIFDGVTSGNCHGLGQGICTAGSVSITSGTGTCLADIPQSIPSDYIIWLAKYDSTASFVRRGTDGTQITGSGATVSLGGITLGSRFRDNPGEYLNGDIAEMFVFDNNLTTTQHNNFGNYLATKYGLIWTAM